MLSVMELQAVADGLLDPSEAVKLERRPGGRPKGSKQLAPDALDKAIAELRSRTSKAEIAESERRIAALLKSRAKRDPLEHDLVARATAAEKRVAEVYRRQEDRIGMSRERTFRSVTKVKGQAVEKLRHGYVAEPYPECVPFVDVGLRVERHPNGWLAPINATQSFTLHKLDIDHLIETGEIRHKAVKTVTGAGTGSNGHAYAVPAPTVAEGYAAYLEDPGRESDWSGCPLPEPQQVSPAWYEHKTRRRKLLKRVVVGWYGDAAMVPIDYACCVADELLPKAVTPDDPKPVDLSKNGACGKQMLDSAAVCNRAKRVPNKHGKAGEPMYVVQGVYRRAPLASYVRRRSTGEVTPTGKDDAWCNGVHLDDLLKLASRDPSEIKLPVIQPVVEGFLPKRLDVVYSMADAKPTSVVWFRPIHGRDDCVADSPLRA